MTTPPGFVLSCTPHRVPPERLRNFTTVPPLARPSRPLPCCFPLPSRAVFARFVNALRRGCSGCRHRSHGVRGALQPRGLALLHLPAAGARARQLPRSAALLFSTCPPPAHERVSCHAGRKDALPRRVLRSGVIVLTGAVDAEGSRRFVLPPGQYGTLLCLPLHPVLRAILQHRHAMAHAIPP